MFAAIYLGALFAPGLLDDADATHAEAAREMAASGDFVTLKVNGVRYLEKAPLPYWLAAISFRIFGVNEFSSRLPLALGVLGSMLLAAHWAGRAFGPRAGAYAGMFMLTGTGVFLFTRVFIPEVLLGLFLAVALYSFLRALDAPHQPWRWYAGYAALALAVLTKGLVALVFAAGAAFLFLALTGEWRRWREFRIFTGLALLLAIAAPWHILAGMRNQGGMNGHGFFWFYFVNEHFLRFLGRRFPKDYNKMPALVYWTAHLAWLFPWSLFLPLAIQSMVERWRARRKSASAAPWDFATRSRVMCAIYAAMILLFFSVSTNQEYYTFPAYLPLFILLAAAVAAFDDEAAVNGAHVNGAQVNGAHSSPWVTGAHVVYALVGMAAAAALLSGVWTSRHLPFVPDIGTVLARRAVGGYTLSMSHFFDLTGESLAALRMPAALAAAALLIGPLTALALRLRRRHAAATWTMGVTAAIFLVAAQIAFARFEPFLSSKRIAAQLELRLHPGDQLMIYGDQSFGSSLLFYMRRPVYLVNGNTTSMFFGSTFPDAPRIFLDDQALERRWRSPERVFLFVPEERRAQVESLLGPEAKVVITGGEKLVYANPAALGSGHDARSH